MKYLGLLLLTVSIIFSTITTTYALNERPSILSCKIGTNPILKTGDLVAGATWNDPSVIFDRGRFVMYASADSFFDHNIKIWRLVSTDGIKWKLEPKQPVLTATSKSWDAQSVETPSVVYFKNKYYLFYTGYAGAYTDVTGYKIGYATSSDGIKWTKMPNPILAPSAPNAPQPNMEFNQYIVGEPGVVLFNGKLLVYFTAVGADRERNGILQSIGMIESKDGINWSTPQQVLKPAAAIYSRNNNIKGFSTPAAAVIGGNVHLFTNVVTENPYQQIALHHAWSKNGINGWTQDTGPFLTRDKQSWTKDGIVSPSVLPIAGSKIHLWFAGNAALQLSIGYGACTVN